MIRGFLSILILSVAPAAFAAPADPARSLSVAPAKLVLRGPYAESRLLVSARLRSGAVCDVSDVASVQVADPRIARLESGGLVSGLKDGRTNLIVRFASLKTTVPVEVTGISSAASPRFTTDVIPVLTHAGCNQGACHGAGAGKGGFKLSLLGYDPDADFDAITRGALMRRINRAAPERSLVLLKPTMQVPHRGGKRFAVGSMEYRVLGDWIAAGAPPPSKSEPRVVSLEVTPSTRTLTLNQTQRFAVKARYSDGSTRDATSETLFGASDESVARVSLDGEAKAVGPGEGAVVVRYQGLVAIARVVSPFGRPTTDDRPRASDAARQPRSVVRRPSSVVDRPIDRLISDKLAALGLQPSPRCPDSDFLRRAYLDAIGVLPTVEETRAFLADRDPNKREKLIDSLLARPEYVDFWALKWGDLLRSNRKFLSERGLYAYNDWIRRSVAENKPWDRTARELLLAQGSTYENGPANYFRTASGPSELAETTSQAFLGVRIQCAKCHNHPYDKWTQNQYYQMAAFFARIKAKKGEGEKEMLVYAAGSGEVRHPKTQKEVAPCALDAPPASVQGDRREALADWLTSPKNPFFARAIANRLWKHFMGRGLVEPVDDFRATNPASNEALLDWLAKDLIAHGYDLKRLMREIMRSDAYQRSAISTAQNARDTRYLSHFAFKRLSAEQLLDALAAATGVPEKFAGLPGGTRAEQLPDSSVPSYFLDLFGRPARNITCACERTDDPNLGQVLLLMNDPSMNARLSNNTGRVATLMDSKKPNDKIVEDLYLASLSRYPTPAESGKAAQALSAAKNKQQTAEDLLWALLNSKEFLFNH